MKSVEVILFALGALVSVPILTFWGYILFATIEKLVNHKKVSRFILDTKVNLRA